MIAVAGPPVEAQFRGTKNVARTRICYLLHVSGRHPGNLEIYHSRLVTEFNVDFYNTVVYVHL